MVWNDQCRMAGKCFAKDVFSHCRVLEDTEFDGRDCPFRKTEEELEDARAAAVYRLRRRGLAILVEKSARAPAAGGGVPPPAAGAE